MNANSSSRDGTIGVVCAGLNAHSQLQPGTTANICKFASLLVNSDQHEQLNILFAGWSTTIVSSRDKIWSLGSQELAKDITAQPRSAFGDQTGLVGHLNDQGGLILATASSQGGASSLDNLMTDDSPLLSHIAMAGNERIAVTSKQTPTSGLCHIMEFEDLEKFIAWYNDPAGEGNRPDQHHMQPGKPKQLLANAATFLLLMESGEAYSWGDPRYQSLGRDITGEDGAPADKPGLVQAIGGLQIRKIASGGWMSAALSLDGALYMWGAATAPGAERSIKCLREAPVGEVALIQISDVNNEPLDVLDVALGDAHAAIVVKNNDGDQLHVVGDNKNGQLGLGSEQEFVEDWALAKGIGHVHQVACGPRSTYAFVLQGNARGNLSINS